MVWSAVDIFTQQGLKFVISIILARLLSPSEYGTIALLYIFLELAAVFNDNGFSSALVQRRDVTHRDESSVFWFQLMCSLLLATLLCGIAPWIAEFYDKPVLQPLMWVMALSFFITSLGSIQHVLLTKSLDFKRPMKVSVVSGIISGGVAVVLAMQGYGVWALAGQNLVMAIVYSCLLWGVGRWRPAWAFSFASLRKLFAYGGYLMLSNILMVSYNRIYTLYVGKVYSVHDLGIYSRADNTKQMPLTILSKIYERVAFPVFSKASDDKEKLLRGVRLALKGMMLITAPVMAGLMVSADEVVLILFGEAWLESAPILQILCLAGLFWPLQIVNTNLQKALGHSRVVFNSEILKKIIGIGFIVMAFPYGIVGIAWSQVAYGCCSFLINAYFSGKFLGYGVFAQLRDMLPIVCVSALMTLSIYQFGHYVLLQPYWLLAAKIAIGASVFLLGALLFRLNAIRDLRLMLS